MNRIFISTAIALVLTASASANTYGPSDLRHIHAEYAANEARWANTYDGQTFDGVLPVNKVEKEIIGGGYYVTFMEDPTDWMPGVYCNKMPTSQFLLGLNSGSSVHIHGVIDGHSFGSVNLRNCSLSMAPTPEERAKAEADAAKAEADSAQAKAEADAQAKAEADAKAQADADIKAKVEADRARIETEAKAKIEAEKAQIEADAKAKVRAKIEADLRAQAVADATAKAEAEAKADIEAASKAKDQAAATAKANEDARLEAEAFARQEDQVRKDKEAADAKVRADARAKEQAIADQAEIARQAREADEKARAAEAQAAADKAAEEARIAAQEQAAHEANLKKVADAREAAVINKKARKAAWMATNVKAESYQLAMGCNELPEAKMRPLWMGDSVDPHIEMDTWACQLLDERGIPKRLVNGQWHYDGHADDNGPVAPAPMAPESSNDPTPAQLAPSVDLDKRVNPTPQQRVVVDENPPAFTAEVPPAVAPTPAMAVSKPLAPSTDTFVANCSKGKKEIALTINEVTNDASVAVNDGTVVYGTHKQAADENGAPIAGHFIYESNTATVWYIAPHVNPTHHSAVKAQGKWMPMECSGFRPTIVAVR
jgi:hypothetical protein